MPHDGPRADARRRRVDPALRIRNLILPGLAVLWIAGAVGGTAARSGPPISWSPGTLAITAAPGSVQTTVVTFTSSANLSNLAVEVVPALRPYLQVTPAHLPAVQAGVPVDISLTFTVPESAAPGVLDGTLKLRHAGTPPRTHPLPLPITLTVVPGGDGGLVVTGRVAFDSGGPVAGATVRGSLVSEQAVEAVQIVRQEQRELAASIGNSKDAGLQSQALMTASPMLATSVPVDTTTGADGSFVLHLGPAAVPVRVRVEVSYQPASLPRVDVAKWDVALGNTLDMGIIVLPDPIGAEMAVGGGAAQSADGSLEVTGLPPEVDRLFGRTFDPDESPEAFPGEFTEMGAIPLNSSLFLWMEALDAQGNPVDDLSQAITIRARIPRSQWIDLEDIDAGTDRIEIPIYTFNEATSMWEQMGIGWLEDDESTMLAETAQAAILDGSFPREIFAVFTTVHLSWMNVDYAYIGPWTLSRMDSASRNDDCFFNAIQIAKTIARSAFGQLAFSACAQPDTDVGGMLTDANGPEIKASAIPPPGSEDANPFGWFSGSQLDQFHMRSRLWDSCGPDATEFQKKETTVKMAVTILHETAHWLCHIEEIEEPDWEAGHFVTGQLFGLIVLEWDQPLRTFPGLEPVDESVLDAWLDPDVWPPPAGVSPLLHRAVSPLQISSPLDLLIALPKDTFDLGEEIPVTVTYTNVSGAPLVIPGVVLLEGNPLAFVIQAAGAPRRVPFAGMRVQPALGPDDFVTLEPGASLVRTVDILRDPAGGPRYSPVVEGTYQITAVYSSLWGLPETRSNAVTFAVGAGGRIAGIVTDAATAQPVAGATVTARLNGTVVATAPTGPNGAYTLTSLPAGVYTLEAHSPTHSLARRENVQVVAGQTTTVDFSLSSLVFTGELRIELTWGEVPSDLDAHLWLPVETPYHVYHGRKGAVSTCPFAMLDRDDFNGFGPEIITIAQRFDGQYTYAVNRGIFGATGPIAGSGALVQVFDSNGLIASVTAPAEGTGNWWNVLTIDGATGAITIVDEIVVSSPEPYPDTDVGCAPPG